MVSLDDKVEILFSIDLDDEGCWVGGLNLFGYIIFWYQVCGKAYSSNCWNISGYKEKVYLGVSETTFKVRYGNQKQSFTKQHHKNDMELSKEYWKVKQQNGTPRIKWTVLKKCHAYNQ